MTTTTNPTDYFDRMTEDERWLGWGYLGERSRCEDPAKVAEVDAYVMHQIKGWTDEERFHWANSKNGRWAADGLFGGVEPALVLGWGVFSKVKP